MTHRGDAQHAVVESTAHDEGERLDVFLSQKLGISRAQAKRLVQEKKVEVHFTGDLKLSAENVWRPASMRNIQGRLNDKKEPQPVRFRIAQNHLRGKLIAESLPIDVVHEDADIVIINKPKGLPTQPLHMGEAGTLANRLVARFPESERLGNDWRDSGLVQRLDSETSGLILLARTEAAYAHLVSERDRAQIQKGYVALTDQNVEPQVVRTGIDAHHRKKVRVTSLSLGTFAETDILQCTAFGEFFKIEAQCMSATRHQVRAHLAHLGAPLVGDGLYGSTVHLERGHFLHASKLVFKHPSTQRAMTFEVPPADWPIS